MTSIRIICRLTSTEPDFPHGELTRERAPEPFLKRGLQYCGKKEVAGRQRQAAGTDRYRQNRAGSAKDDSQKTSAAETGGNRQNSAGSVKDGSQRMPVFRPKPRKIFCGRMHAEFTVKVEGHSGYAPYGQDLVCAGVSMLTFTLAAATGCRIEAESGRAVLHFRGHVRQLYTVLCGFVLLSRTYPDYVRIKPLVRLDSLGGAG